ncbi:unnamed protein product [Lasius platythorax]|uniref:F-box domain-containing protein n=1 Tax=Lasius platythorax TaxID=488582 RepID=A0AAV2NNY7_9HYME
MATITLLPDEVILLILENESISMEDLMSFASTCKRFQSITQNNKLWEKKFYQR